jgi:hypothetical protein
MQHMYMLNVASYTFDRLLLLCVTSLQCCCCVDVNNVRHTGRQLCGCSCWRSAFAATPVAEATAQLLAYHAGEVQDAAADAVSALQENVQQQEQVGAFCVSLLPEQKTVQFACRCPQSLNRSPLLKSHSSILLRMQSSTQRSRYCSLLYVTGSSCLAVLEVHEHGCTAY